MKWMIISDIHGSLDDLKKVIDIFEEEKMDRMILLGDLLYHGPRNPLPKGYQPKEVAILLNQYKDKIIAVRGNCDAEVDQMVLDFPMRADYSELYIDGHHFFMTHGHLYDEDHMPLLQSGDILMYGHYHKPIAKKKDGIVIFNPSSISLPKAGGKSFGVYENHELKIFSLEKTLLQSIKL
ncbi:phosphodiesterase [Longibaculum muris]|uniref:phosphodiesterase n=1 Tax=Longibaculum muris TaxID=1796628 RepID=UPI0012B8ADED|nr:phosphodiesterase [Longibaculum muris]